MGAFVDYLDLRLAVSDTVKRDDISDVMPRFVKLAESYLNKELRVREMETPVTLTFTANLAPLPTDFLEVKNLWSATGFAMREATEEQVKQAQNTDFGYAVKGASSIYIYGLDAATRNMIYYAALPTLTATVTTSNWLLQKCENLYLYAVSYEAAKWMRDKEMAGDLYVLAQDEMRELRRADHRARFGDALIRPSRGDNP